jgi:hypothetical protein
MFQAVTLQSLVNFEHQEGDQFKFQSLGYREALKIRNRVGPTFSGMEWKERLETKARD